MSGNRANASAIQRRTNGANPPSVPQQQVRQPARPGGQGQLRQNPNQGQGQGQAQGQAPTQKPRQAPKISVSDAIALTTLRLGRVESFINSLPPLDQIGNGGKGGDNSSESISENMRIVDEAVFTSIVSRLEKMEQNNVLSQTQSQSFTQKTQGNINVLLKSIESVKKEVTDLKEMFLTLQKFVIESTKVIEDNEFEVEVDFEKEEVSEEDKVVEEEEIVTNNLEGEIAGVGVAV